MILYKTFIQGSTAQATGYQGSDFSVGSERNPLKMFAF